MIIYLAVPAVVFLGQCILYLGRIKINQSSTKLLFLTFTFLIPVLIYGFRDTSIGWDTVSYAGEYSVVGDVSLGDILSGRYTGSVVLDTEIGFLLLNWLLAHLGLPLWAFYLIVGTITNLLYARAIYYSSPIVFISSISYLFLYNFLYGLSIMQQGIAAGILLNSFIYLSRKEYKKYFLWIILATTFHVFSFVFIFLLIPTILIKKRTQLVATLIVAVSGILFSMGIVRIIVFRYFPHFTYFFRVNYQADQTFGIGSTMYILIDVVCICLLVGQFQYKEESKHQIIYLTLTMAIGGAALIMMPVFGIYQRISKFFHTFIIIGSASAVDGIKKPRRKILIGGGYALLTFMYYLYYVIRDKYDIVPYVFYKGGG